MQDPPPKYELNVDSREPVEENREILKCITNEVQSETKSTKYFNPCPEVRQMNLLIARKKKPFLLPNGSLSKYPVNIDGIKVFLRLTCGFDSLVHALMTGALDDIEYSNFLKTSTNETMQFVCKLINTGVTKEILQNRGVLLKKLGYPLIAEISTERRVLSCSLNATNSIVNIVKKTLDTSTLSYLPLNHWKIRSNIGNLETALDFRPEIYEVHCKRCKGTLKLHQRLNHHITIDMDIRETTASGVAKKGLRCKLKEIPTTISLPIETDVRVTYKYVRCSVFIQILWD